MTISPVSTRSSTRSSSLDPQTIAIKDEIATIWAQVQARVVQLAGGDAAQVQPNLNIDGVLSLLDKAQDAAAPKDSPVRSAFNTTLQFIDTVGSVIAGGAAEVFGPSELCFNAISFVINAWQGYQGVFESLAGLLEQCSQYLSRLEYYRSGGMDAKLAKVACQHLQLFVEICDRAIQLRQSKRRKLIVFTKVFFLNDNDIQDLLDKMASLVDEEGRLVTAQTFTFAAQAAIGTREALAITRAVNRKIDRLLASAAGNSSTSKSDQIRDADTRRRRETVLRTLAFDDNSLDRERREPDPVWQRTYHNFRKSVVPDTGQWIFEDPTFVAWEHGTGPAILLVEGVEGAGKSYLASTIIRRLRNRSAVESDGVRTLLAFSFLEDDAKEALRTTNTLDGIVKALVWQFAQADASYLKSAASICEKRGDMDPHEIPDLLLFSRELRRAVDATFLIVLDGVGDIIGDALVRFLAQTATLPPDHGRVRVLLTGRPRAGEQLAAVPDVRFETLPISRRNRTDVEAYVYSRMDRIEALKDPTRIGVQGLRQKIAERLAERTAGDYFRINTVLKHISTLDYVHDIDQVLADAGQERSEQIRREIAMLNRMRTTKEIAEINEIIRWILYGREWFPPRMMAAVLYEQTGELSLLPLETKLQTKYSIFEIDSDGDIDFRSYEIPELIAELTQRVKNGDDDDDEATQPIHAKEIAIVRHFLNSVCPPDLYAKFDFEAFFEQKRRHEGSRIGRDDKDTAEVKLALTCLRVLTERRDERQELLRPYAMAYFLPHLAAVDLSFVGREWKAAVGPRLLQLFTEETSIDALLWTTDMENAPVLAVKTSALWFDGGNGVSEVLRWLRDSAVISSITDETARAWISRITSSTSPGEDLLKPFAKRMAVHWLCETSPQALAVLAFSFVWGYMRMIETEDSAEDDILEPTVDDISAAEDFSRKLLDIKTHDSLWDVQVASILENFYYTNDAEQRCRRALKQDANNWRASYYLSCVVTSDEDAISILAAVTTRLANDTAWMAEAPNQASFAEMLFALGQRYWETKQYDSARDAYTRALTADTTASDRALTILERYHSRHQHADIVALLETLEPSLAELLVSLAAQESLHTILLITLSATQKTTLLDTIYDRAIAHATSTHAYTSLYHLRYHYATALFQRATREDAAITLWEQALKEDLPRSSLRAEDILPSLTLKLAPVYLRRARAATNANDSDTVHRALQHISDLLPDEVAESNILAPAKLYIARYYQVTGDGARARQIARSVVKLALEILSDDDDDNDYLAYWRLLLVFLPLGDEKNAFAALTMAALATRVAPIAGSRENSGDAGVLSQMVSEVESPVSFRGEKEQQQEQEKKSDVNGNGSSTSSTDTIKRSSNNNNISNIPTPSDDSSDSDSASTDSDTSSATEIPNFQSFAICDGECGHHWQTASEMWWCKDCINLTFERGCFRRLQLGTLPLKVCDKDHEFLEVPPWDEEKMSAIPKGWVPYDGEAISLEEWKRMIAREYLDQNPSFS